MKRYLAIVATASLLTACVPYPRVQMKWAKEGATKKEYLKAKYECMKEASTAAPPSAGEISTNMGFVPVDVNNKNRDQLAVACMEAKGWELVPQNSGLAPY